MRAESQDEAPCSAASLRYGVLQASRYRYPDLVYIRSLLGAPLLVDLSFELFLIFFLLLFLLQHRLFSHMSRNVTACPASRQVYKSHGNSPKIDQKSHSGHGRWGWTCLGHVLFVLLLSLTRVMSKRTDKIKPIVIVGEGKVPESLSEDGVHGVHVHFQKQLLCLTS